MTIILRHFKRKLMTILLNILLFLTKLSYTEKSEQKAKPRLNFRFNTLGLAKLR